MLSANSFYLSKATHLLSFVFLTSISLLWPLSLLSHYSLWFKVLSGIIVGSTPDAFMFPWAHITFKCMDHITECGTIRIKKFFPSYLILAARHNACYIHNLMSGEARPPHCFSCSNINAKSPVEYRAVNRSDSEADGQKPVMLVRCGWAFWGMDTFPPHKMERKDFH